MGFDHVTQLQEIPSCCVGGLLLHDIQYGTCLSRQPKDEQGGAFGQVDGRCYYTPGQVEDP